jgi:hypothetical protein
MRIFYYLAVFPCLLPLGCATSPAPLTVVVTGDRMFGKGVERISHQTPGLRKTEEAPDQRIQVWIYQPLEDEVRAGGFAYISGGRQYIGKITKHQGFLGHYQLYDTAETEVDSQAWETLRNLDWPALEPQGEDCLSAPDDLWVRLEYWDGPRQHAVTLSNPVARETPCMLRGKAAMDAAFAIITPE